MALYAIDAVTYKAVPPYSPVRRQRANRVQVSGATA